jgi:hypothetical protein
LKTTADPSLKWFSFDDFIVTPYRMDVVPDELLPTIPPIIQRLEVVRDKKIIRVVLNTNLVRPLFKPVTVLTGSKAMILVKYFDTSTIPLPTVCPAPKRFLLFLE